MKSLGGFFEKFNNKVAGQIQNLVVIIEIIKKNTGIEIEMKQIVISAGVLRLKLSSVQKSQIYIKKMQILNEINKKVSRMVLKDIN